MSYKGYDARNSNLTLGIEIIETNRYMKEILRDSNNMSNIDALRDTVSWLDALLQRYRGYMQIRFYDPFAAKFVEYGDYDNAIKAIMKNVQNSVQEADEGMIGRRKYVFWLLRWYELLASCFHKLSLVPPKRMDETNKDMLIDEELQGDGYIELPGEPGEESEEDNDFPVQPI